MLIFTDSQSVLKSLQDCYHESSIIQNILLLHRLIYKITNTSISLKWCPGHNDILGNELEDFFAKKATQTLIPVLIFFFSLYRL